jgi:hypothetical protein
MRRRRMFRNQLTRGAQLLFEATRRSAQLAGGVLIGIWVNALSGADRASLWRTTIDVFDVTARPAAWVAVTAGLILVIRPLVPAVQNRLAASTDEAVLLSDRLAALVDPRIRSFHRGRIAWGAQLVLQSCPRIEEGWRQNEIRLEREPTEFTFTDPAELATFRSWLHTVAAKNAHGGGFNLVRNPTAFTDDPELHLRIQPVRYVAVRFYQRNRAILEEVRARHIARVIETGEITFPHKFCLHAVIATADGRLLLTRRSDKVDYHPQTWSCSVEEQLSPDDVRHPDTNIVLRWTHRMLTEELGLDAEDRSRSQARYLAVFLETDILNCTLAALVTLDMSSTRLDAIIRSRPRQDYEYQDWTFLRWEEVTDELMRPSRIYHPSSGLRMFLAGIVRFGVYGLEVRLRRSALSPSPPPG